MGKVKLKVFLGYLVLIILSTLIIWVIYSEYIKSERKKYDSNQINEKIMLINSILANLYQSESLGRNYAYTGITKHYDEYISLMDSIDVRISAMEEILDSTTQKSNIDQFKILINEKKLNLEELSLIKKDYSIDALYNDALSKINSIPEPKKPTDSETQLDSIYIQAERKNVLKRIANVFSKQRRDSTLFVIQKQGSESEIESSDYYMNMIKDIRNESIVLEKYIKEKEQKALDNDLIITIQLRQVLSLIEQTELMNSYLKVEKQQENVKKATIYIIILGSLSLLAIIFFLINISNDITKSQHYRKSLEKANAYSEFLLHSKEQFMLSLTHDLKSPLNSIIGFAGLLKNSDSNKEQLNYIDNIKKSSEYILRLINDLLDIARLDSGKLKIDCIPFDMVTLIEDMIENFRPQALSKGLTLIDNISFEGNAWYVNDPMRIKQILSNLISNAIKFTEKGSVTICASLISSQQNTDTIKIDITDTGIGISTEDMSQLFKEFGRIDSTNDQEGTGLGLVITQKLTTMLKGTIDVESQPETGSCFSVQLPLDKTDVEPTQNKQTETAKATDMLSGKTAWLVDDDLILREMMICILNPTGLIVNVFDNPIEAIEKFDKGCADFLISDVKMPQMNGLDLVKNIRKKNEGNRLVTILMSGQTEIQDKPDDIIFIQKPFQPLQLITAMLDSIEP